MRRPDPLAPILLRFSLLALAAWLTATHSGHAAGARPNVLLIVTDDQGYWETGVAGNTRIETPTMDRLAADGVTLTRFYACPVCSPTRAGLMTGRYYLRTGLYNTRFGGDTMDAAEVTLAQVLRVAGYRTGLFGKWHLGAYSGYQPQQRGFDEFLGHYHGHIERYDYPDQLVHNGRPVQTRGYITDLLTDATIDFIRTAQGKPFFCYLAYNAPHSPWVASDSHDGQPRGDAVIDKYLQRGLPLRDARIYALVDLVDQNLTRLFATLDELGQRDNTIVFFMSDNGGVSKAYSAGLRGYKASVYEGGVRVPFFARWPGRFPAGVKVDSMASHLDILPTLCDLLELPLPEGRKLDGRSIRSLLTAGRGVSPHEYLCHTWNRYTPSDETNGAICSDRYKLVVPQKPKSQGQAARPSAKETPTGSRTGSKKPTKKPVGPELYDLQADPGEQNNIAADHPQIVADLHARFRQWFQDVTAGRVYQPLPIPVGQPDENPVEIQASWARLEGTTVQYLFRAYDWDTIEGWNRPGDSAAWELDVRQAGRYAVMLSYGCCPTEGGGTLRISAGNAQLEFPPKPTVTAEVFCTAEAGVLDLAAGRQTLKAQVVRAAGKELMRLNRIWLRKVAP